MPDAIWSGNYDPDVPNGFRKCLTCGACVTPGDMRQHENFHKTFTNLRSEDMSRVSWCDYGDHAFKSGESGSASFEGTEYDSNGVPISKTMDACSSHNPLNVAKEAAKYALTPAAYDELNKEV